MKSIRLKYFAELMVNGLLFMTIGLSNEINNFFSLKGYASIVAICILAILYFVLRRGNFEIDDELSKGNILKSKVKTYEAATIAILILNLVLIISDGVRFTFTPAVLSITFGGLKILEFIFYMYYESRNSN